MIVSDWITSRDVVPGSSVSEHRRERRGNLQIQRKQSVLDRRSSLGTRRHERAVKAAPNRDVKTQRPWDAYFLDVAVFDSRFECGRFAARE